MTVAARHLETRRPRKDRDVTWSRRTAGSPPGWTRAAWTFWRRDHRNAWHMRVVLVDEGGFNPRALHQAWRDLRDFVDEIDLAMMEKMA